MFRTTILAAALHGAAAAQGPSSGSMSKAIDMLMDMSAKVKQEKNDEQVAFSKFGSWCQEEKSNLAGEITADASEIDSLTSEIAELGSEVKGLGENIKQLQADVEKFDTEIVEEKEQRAKDHAEFQTESADFAESVDALERALETMSSENYDRPGSAAALLQVSDAKHVPVKVKSILAAFMGLSMAGDGLGYDAPEANAYEFQSGGIVTLLKKLTDDFRAKLGESQKREANMKAASAMVVQDLTDSVEAAKKDIGERSMTKKRKEEKKANDESQLTATEAAKAQSEKTLADMKVECSEKQLSFGEKQQLREEEIAAIAKAVEILGSPEVAGQADKHFSFAQLVDAQTSAVSLAQLRADTLSPRRRVRDFLENESKRLHSQGLGLLAEKLSNDPFAKVKQMIDGMVTRLLEEANEDAQHEGFCDTEIGKSKITRTKLTEDIDSLAAAIDSGKSTILHLTNRIAELSTEVAKTDQSLLEAADLRASEKQQNIQTISEARVAQQKVAAATAVLKEFYETAAGTTALVQAKTTSDAHLVAKAQGVKMGSDEWNSLANPAFEGQGGYAAGAGSDGIASSKVDKGHREGMQTFGGSYKGQQDAAGGVLTLLEVILSDFANLEADTTASEDSAQRSYEQFVTESNRDKATKSKQAEMDTTDRTNTQNRLQEDTADWKATQDELLAAERYHAKLVPQCMDPGQTFEERTASRQAEIASLKEALKILNNGDITTSA